MSSGTWPQADEGPDPLPKSNGLLTGVFIGVVVVGLLMTWVLRAQDVAVAMEGRPAPDFSVALFDGSQFSLSDHFSGDAMPIVLNLWASWCAPCRAEIPEISRWAVDNPDVYVLGMAVEDVEADARVLADELEPSYDLAIGDSEFRSSYPSIGLPATYILDENGKVIELINGRVTEESLDSVFAATAG